MASVLHPLRLASALWVWLLCGTIAAAPAGGTTSYANDFERFLYTRTKADLKVHKIHHYFTIYEQHFAPLRASGRKLRMLEIGVQSGGSLLMWKDYFGEQLELHGIDINPRCARFNDLARQITVHIGATSDAHFMSDRARKLAPLDIVLDDGSHHSPDILAAFEFFYPAVRVEPAPGGVYIAEDLLTNYMASGEFLEGPGVAGTFMERTKQLIDQLNAHNAWNLTNAMNPRESLPCKRRPCPPPAKRLMVSDEFTTTTTGIHVYDSMVVFERGPHPPATNVLRGGVGVKHDYTLEHQRSSALQVKRARAAAHRLALSSSQHNASSPGDGS